MIFIRKAFEEVVHAYKRVPEIKAILDKLFRYKLSIQSESPRLKSQNIHVIGMAHYDIAPNGQTHVGEHNVIASQGKLIVLLEELSPVVVGIEGFSGEKFSYPAGIQEGFRMQNFRCFDSDIETRIKRIRNNPQQIDFYNYVTNNPKVTFCGVEDFELCRLQTLLHLKKITLPENDYIILTDGLLRLRGVMMIIKLSRIARKQSSSVSALPVGFLHLEELAEFKEHLNAQWTIHDTANITLDLPH